jgi:hypothetical protein
MVYVRFDWIETLNEMILDKVGNYTDLLGLASYDRLESSEGTCTDADIASYFP